MTQPVVRLHLFFATENSTAIILRQGPTRQFRLIAWDRETDTFADGQWLKQKVYVDRCDLSPDGRHFLYFVVDGKWHRDGEGAYTAISRPPYFTALSLFPEGSTWGGGGRFLDSRHYLADGDDDIIGRDEGLIRLFRRTPTDHCKSGLFRADGRCAKLGRAKIALANRTNESPSRVHARDLHESLGGKLYRRRGEKLALIRDFTDMTFEEVRAPYDWREPASWHPLDDDG